MTDEYKPSQEVLEYFRNVIAGSKDMDAKNISMGTRLYSLNDILKEMELGTPSGIDFESSVKEQMEFKKQGPQDLGDLLTESGKIQRKLAEIVKEKVDKINRNKK